MKEAFPNYYFEFKCIADKCKHNCCIGWEIDVDGETLDFYNSLDTPLGERIRNNITGDEPHFVLSENDRCPFLNNKNLCDIITECGEDAVCEICRLHPRFRNFYDDFVETGLGLCCEEVARIVLFCQDKFSIIIPDKVSLTAEEKEFFEIRNNVFNVLQDRSVSIKGRFEKLASMFRFDMDFSLPKLCNLYLSLERLDDAWTYELDNLRSFVFDEEILEDDDFAIAFEQLACYFVFRHLTDALEFADYKERIRFSVVSCYMIGALWSFYKDKLTKEKMIDIVRMYSSEIEYSEENTQALL